MKKSLIVLGAILLLALFAGNCKEAVAVSCTDSVKKLDNQESSFAVKCPANCTSGSVWGTDTYTSDSAICMAAVHAGVITAAEGGEVTVTKAAGESSYNGSQRNGVSTSNWGSYDSSFTVK
ncbi:MAG: hypothetical protein KDK34_24760 [Leptospiraceae bacterium]|nr:hypothetical protein [Leptospiraceae bacterium]